MRIEYVLRTLYIATIYTFNMVICSFVGGVTVQVAMAGFTEVVTWILCSHEENFKMVNRKDDGNTAVIIGNPRGADFEVELISICDISMLSNIFILQKLNDIIQFACTLAGSTLKFASRDAEDYGFQQRCTPTTQGSPCTPITLNAQPSPSGMLSSVLLKGAGI